MIKTVSDHFSCIRPAVLSARAAARELIKDISSPPTPIFDIAKKIAPVVYVIDSGIKDAVCVRSKKGEYRIFVELDNNMHERVRYSTAHELAHIVLDHYSYLMKIAHQKKVKIKKSFLLLWNEVPELSPFVRKVDREAEIFAAEILMPVRWLYRPRSSDDFEELRRKLLVSVQALKIRLAETGIMPLFELDALLNKKAGI